MSLDSSEQSAPVSRKHSRRSSESGQDKRKSIEEACKRHDFETLVRLATSTGGLLTDELRQQACMSFLLSH